MNYIKGATYFTNYPGWFKKLFIGGIVTAVPFFGGAASNGYQIQVYRNLVNDSPNPLPEWENMGGYFSSGLKLLLAIYTLYIPAVTLTAISWIVAIIRAWNNISWLFGTDQQTRVQTSLGVSIFSILLQYFLVPLLVSTLLPITFLFVPAMLRQCARNNSFFSAFHFAANLGFILRHLGSYVMAFVIIEAVRLTLFPVTQSLNFIIPAFGSLLALVLFSMVRFWTRLMWAGYLAQMDMGVTSIATVIPSPNPPQNYQQTLPTYQQQVYQQQQQSYQQTQAQQPTMPVQSNAPKPVKPPIEKKKPIVKWSNVDDQ